MAAAGIVVANEVIFSPVAANKPVWDNFNWRIIPATAIAALSLAGVEKISEPLGKGLAILALMVVIIQPMGNAPSPLDNVAKYLQRK